ncbi:MAG: PH domain-containing protein [Fimbriimonadaceae bacterium]
MLESAPTAPGIQADRPMLDRFHGGAWVALHPNVRVIWVVSALLSAGFTLVLFSFLEFYFLWGKPFWPFLFPVGALTAGGAITLPSLVLVGAQYRNWRFALRESELLIQYGVIWRTKRSIPRSRIQHVDLQSGPVDRMLGVVQVSVYTAGSLAAVASIPGLDPGLGEALRQELLRTSSVVPPPPPGPAASPAPGADDMPRFSL